MRGMSGVALAGFVILAVLSLAGPADAQCPPQKRVEELINKFETPERRLITLRPTDYSGLCEVHVQLNGKTHIFYTGPTGDYFLNRTIHFHNLKHLPVDGSDGCGHVNLNIRPVPKRGQSLQVALLYRGAARMAPNNITGSL